MCAEDGSMDLKSGLAPRSLVGCLILASAIGQTASASESLPSWNDTGPKKAIAAFGNSDGDLQMLQWASAGDGGRFALFVHHDDATREYAYDRTDKLQKFDKGWDEATANGWTIVSMKNDWKVIYPPL
jgi:hypothetical protein